jgi:hypothetical protein
LAWLIKIIARAWKKSMTPQALTYEEKLNLLKNQVKGSLEDTWKKYTINNNLDTFLTISYIMLSTAVTILGFFGQATIAGIVGAILTLLLSFRKVFNFSEKASFCRGFHIQTKELRDKLTFKVSTEEELLAIVDSFIAMRNERILKNPMRGSLDK